ncbi:4Fe-4S dicluster domain-containing protein, partial [Candidatus Allofournierella excrementavium]
GCPAAIRIPDRFAAYNARLRGETDAAARYAAVPGGEASACVGCGACEKACPQKLPIRKLLALAAREFEQ